MKRTLPNALPRSNEWVATIVLQSNKQYSNEERLDALSRIVDVVSKETEGNGVIVFPGGWFNAGAKAPRSLYEWVEKKIKDCFSRNERTIIVCLGIDGSFDAEGYAHDQIAIANSKKGIEAIGRKFHPAPGEQGLVVLANDHQSKEENRLRVFEFNKVRYYMCVCYDSFGLRHQALRNPGIDVVLNLVHCFYPRGKGPSGDSYFAKYGFAGASMQWKCPVFGAVVYFNRSIPEHWPSGVCWNQGSKSTCEWRYTDNPIKPKSTVELSSKEGLVSVRIYDLDGIIRPQASI